MQSYTESDIGVTIPSVRPSVHLSVTFWYRVKTAKRITEILSPPGSLITVVFLELMSLKKIGRGHHK